MSQCRAAGRGAPGRAARRAGVRSGGARLGRRSDARTESSPTDRAGDTRHVHTVLVALTDDDTDPPAADGARSSRTADTWTPVQVGLVLALCAVSAVVSVLSPNDPWHDFFDLRVYRGAVDWWLHGRALYDFTYAETPYGFTYPPFAALVVLPMVLLPTGVVAWLHALVNLVVLAVLSRWLVTPLARRHGWPLPFAWVAAVPVLFVLEPVRETIGFGQVNLLLAALVLADVVGLRRGSRWAGVGIGLAAAVKLTPGLFILLLLLTRRWRAAAVAVGTAGGATLLAALVAPGTSWRFWTETLWQTDRVGRLDKTSNQSLLGGLARLADPGAPNRVLWLLLVVGVLVLALGRAVRAARAGDELVAITLTGLAACLVSPIAWSHHLVWIAPALVVLVDVATGPGRRAGGLRWWQDGRRRTAAGLAGLTVLVFASSAIWLARAGAAHHHDGGIVGIAVEDGYLLLALALVAVLPIRSADLPSAAPGAVRA